MSRYEADDFLTMHAHRLGDDGCPALRERFTAYLDGVVGRARAGHVRAAMARLERERPDDFAAVMLMTYPKARTRAVAPLLGVSHKTVAQRRRKGLALLRAWLQDDAALSA